MRLGFPQLTPVVRATLIVLFGSFVVQSALEGMMGFQLFRWLGLHSRVELPLLWQWATYPLVEVPGGVLARALDLLMIYLFGSRIEEQLGRTRFVQLLVVGVVGGALLPLGFGLLMPSMAMPLAGASSIMWALFGAFAVLSRGAPIGFVLVPAMSAWAMLGVFLVIIAFESMWARTPVPLLAALSALGAGVLFTRWLDRRPPPGKKKKVPAKRRAPHLSVIPGGQSDDERPRWIN